MAEIPLRDRIQLKQVLFTRMEVVSLPQHNLDDKNGLKFGPKNHVKVEYNEDERTYICGMNTILNEDKDPADPYYINMECLVLFEAHPELPKDEALKAVTVTGHSVAYGAIREAVSWMTSRQPFGPLALGLSWLTPTAKDEKQAAAVEK